MPNWCDNTITITAADEVLELLLQKAKGPKYEDSTEIVDFSYYQFFTKELGLIPPDENLVCEYNNETLGCKWYPEVYHVEKGEEYLVLGFQSAWAPPEQGTKRIMDWLAEYDDTAQATHTFYEPGCIFCGVLTYGHGVDSLQEGEYHELDSAAILESSDEDLQLLANVGETTIDALKQLAEETDEITICPPWFKDYI
jgi:hypothetical protein